MSAEGIEVNDETVVVNNEEFDRGVAEAGMSLLQNSRSDVNPREQLIGRMGRQYDGERDIHDVLGYPDEIESEDYRAKYERLDIARRIVELPPDDTWRQAPQVVDTDQDDTTFEDNIQKIDQNCRLYHYLRRLDIVSGIGEYGIMLIGLKDGQPLDEEPNESALGGPDDVAFFTPFAQDHVEDWMLGKHEDEGNHNQPGDERYNKPVKYRIDFNAYLDNEDIPDTAQEGERDLHWVHWKRVIHVAEGKAENDLRGTPRQKPVYNRLIDYEKVVGASAEMFWTGAAPRFHFNIDTEEGSDIPTEQIDKLDDEVRQFVHEMQTYLKTFDTEVEVIGGEEVDPTGVLDNLYAAFSGQTGIPQRILKGSERGELASSQDRANWFDRIRTRQHRFAEPDILRRIVDRFIELGVVTEPTDNTYTVDWPSLFELNQLEESELLSQRAQVPQTIAPMGNTDLLPGEMSDWIEFIETGEINDNIKEGTASSPEEMESVNDKQAMAQFEAGFTANARYERGQKVMFDGKEAVIQEVKTSSFEDHQSEEIEASEDDPQYILVTMDGLAYSREEDITDEEWESDVENPEEDIADEQSNNVAAVYHDVDDPRSDEVFNVIEVSRPPTTNAVTISDVPGLDDPGIGFDSWPDSWEESETPARLIALDAWTSMGAQFDCGGGCCVGEMAPKMGRRGANKFCAAFKDEMLMTTHWRNRF